MKFKIKRCVLNFSTSLLFREIKECSKMENARVSVLQGQLKFFFVICKLSSGVLEAVDDRRSLA